MSRRQRERRGTKGPGRAAPATRLPSVRGLGRRASLRFGGIAVTLLGVLAGVWWWQPGRQPGSSGAGPVPLPAASYVGVQACAECHEQAVARWRGSRHDRAMQPATDASVAGDFTGSRFTYAGVTSTFLRRDGKFVARTDGPDGTLHDYEVKYAFGTAPLQQYLVELPGGRLQALGIAWDTRPREQGGQRWFHLYPGERVTHRDELHWTRPSQNWNYMCAECHSTGVRKNYDPGTRRFSTTYAEVNVGCEACHGAGSNHVAWARRQGDRRRLDGSKGLAIALDERKGVRWEIGDAGTAWRAPPGRQAREVETCGRCHSRRAQLGDGAAHGRPLGDTHRVALLEDGLYYPDGQIHGEVYEYGSFLQSRMFQRGVMCSDCHDPHSGKLRASGSQVCLGCHAAPTFATPKHHFHPAGSRGADCIGCHMPTTTYMVVDPRHDHGFRVPRPDLSVRLGVPNPCTRCHADRPDRWAAAQVERWYGHPARGYQRYAEALAAAADGRPGAAGQLLGVALDDDQPAIARATALSRLGPQLDGQALEALGRGLNDGDPLVRRAAAGVLEHVDPGLRARLLVPMLDDPVRTVRMEAVRALADMPRDRLTTTQRTALDRGLEEYVAAQQFNADRAESHVNLGLLYAVQGRAPEAEAALRTALDIDPLLVAASVNLADLFRAMGRDGDGERVLQDALERDPRSAAAHHAIGLLFVRQKRMPEALGELETAARLAPEHARYGYVYAVALNDAGRQGQALETLQRVLARHPYDRDTLGALVAYSQEQRNPCQALVYARRLAELDPANLGLRQLVERLDAESRC